MFLSRLLIYLNFKTSNIYLLFSKKIILCTLNPLIIYIAIIFLIKFFVLIKKWRNSLYEKFKKKKINKQIDATNNSDYCKNHKIRFKLGLSGYWLELEKYIGNDNELKINN